MGKRHATCKVTIGDTPHGGVKTISYFFDENRKPCTEDNACVINHTELNKDDKQIFSSFLLTKKGEKKGGLSLLLCDENPPLSR